MITTLIKPNEGPKWCFTGVYGPQLDMEKVEFLQELVEVWELLAGSWMLVGDFNLLVNPGHKSNTTINRRMMACFLSKLNVLELKEIYLNGRKYT